MSLKEDIRPVTYLKSRAAELLAQVNRTQRPVIITQNGEPRGVLQDPESYERIRRALGMLKLLAQGEDDIRAGRVSPQSAVFAAVKEELTKRKRKNDQKKDVRSRVG
jgi:prevent-host-death family protein